jgi:parallel beta-helix repeat protein
MTILLNGSLNISSTGNLTFENVTLKMNVSSPKGIFVNAGNFTILDDDNNPATTYDNSNITNNTPTTSGYLFQVSPSSGFVMKDSELHYSSSLYINTTNALIQNSLISNNSIAGVTLLYASGASITGNTIINNGNFSGTPSETQINSQHFADIWSIGSTNNVISNNVISNSIGDGINLNTASNNNVVSGNTISNDVGDAIDSDSRSSYNTITNNNVLSSSTDGISFEDGCNYNLISGNNISNVHDGVYILNSSNDNVSNNYAANDLYAGITLGFFDGVNCHTANSNTITNNTLTRNGNSSQSGQGIQLQNCSSNNVITNNNASNNTGNGINIVYNSNNNNVSNNLFSNNVGDGLYIVISSNNNTISGNAVLNNGAYGIHVSGSTNTILSGNTFANSSRYGIYIDTSTNSVIYNNLLNNTNNSYVDSNSNANSWNTTQQSGTRVYGSGLIGGNYWTNSSGNGYSDTCSNKGNEFCSPVAVCSGCSGTDNLPLTNNP